MIPFDVQLIGGYALHSGRIAEMATGEGKTLVATLPVYLNALTGRGVHLVTVNDYLAARDSEWMGAIYKFLGLTVGCILHDQSPKVRREQYNCDITYGTNAEFGFDYLRDNGMAARRFSAAITTPSWMKWTRSSLMKPARRSSSAARPSILTTSNLASGSRWSNRSSARRSVCAPGFCPKPGSRSKSCTRPMARILRIPRRSNVKPACSFSASKRASRNPKA
jgi:hypothetical protein